VIKDIGLVFDQNMPAGGVVAKTFSASWPSSKVSGTWGGKSWTISFDGTLHRDAVSKALLTPKTVVLQFVERKETKYGDKFGGKTPLLKSVGAGRAIGRDQPTNQERHFHLRIHALRSMLVK
jgi:hypothetical protein